MFVTMLGSTSYFGFERVIVTRELHRVERERERDKSVFGKCSIVPLDQSVTKG